MNQEKIVFTELFKTRTKKNAIEIIQLFRSFPKKEEARIIGRQLIRCASSVAANYRAACRARSKAEFYSKLSICVEEADETVFWLEIATETNLYKPELLSQYKNESEEILKVLAKARKTVSG